MASKQLGKFRQWAGEVISSRDKTTVTEEFRELEKDIELRKDGAQRLFAASETYHRALSKKKDSEALDDPEKLLPIDTLGIVMIVHGEEFGDDSNFGTSLVKLGRAHCKVATLQEAYALTFQDTFLSSIHKFGEDIKEYELQRKKLESRRLSYDAATTKLEKVKNSKKDKDKREAEDELERAKLRYEETSEDVRAHMTSIQENEISQLRELTSFLDLEINFVEQYLSVLKDVKSDWNDVPSARVENSREGPTHIFSREPTGSKFNSVRSNRSMSRASPKPATSPESSDDEESSRSHRPSKQRRSDSNSSKPPSRPTSRASRKRSDSNGTAGGDKETEKADKSRRMSVAGWASSAVGSVTGRGKKNRDKFAALQDDEADQERERGRDEEDSDRNSRHPRSSSLHSITRKISKTRSKESLPSPSPKPPIRILKPPSLQDRKVVRALYDFNGSSDELSFKLGDEIIVVNEVLDGWWMGELDGKKGLFPTPYTEVISSSQQSKPPLPQRYIERKDMNESPSLSSEGETGKPRKPIVVDDDTDEYGTSDLDEEHAYGAHPLVPTRSPFYGPSDDASITSSVAEEEESQRLMPKKPLGETDQDLFMTQPHAQSRKILQSLNPSQAPYVRRSTTTDIPSNAFSSPGKKAPPPPPPRRSTNNLLSASPPIPERRPGTFRTHSSGSLPKAVGATSASSISTHGYDTSPFESSADLATTTGCGNFKQNPFKPKGMCNNCFEFHS